MHIVHGFTLIKNFKIPDEDHIMNIREYLKHKTIIADGAMGTYYAQITNAGDNVSCELANLNNADVVLSIHKEYINSGARLIRTNTFMASCIGTGFDEKESYNVIKEGVRLAKYAVNCCRKEGVLNEVEQVFIAGDIGPLRTGGDLSRQQIVDEYLRMADIFIEQGADAIVFETFPDFYELEEVLNAIRLKSDILLIANFCLNKNGYTTSGISAKRILLQGEKIKALDVCGFNCGIGSGHMKEIFKKLPISEDCITAAMPNAGYPERMQNRMVFMDNADYFADNVAYISSLMRGIVGGCCGTTPKHISLLFDKLKNTAEIVHVRQIEQSDKKVRQPEKNPFMDKLNSGKKVIAVELDPPFDAEYEKLIECGHILKKQGADIITMADSPMGRSRVDSVLMSIKMREETSMDIMPHMCCRDKNLIALRSTLLGAYINGIRNLLFVTGDPVPGINRSMVTGVFDYNSIQLMNFVKEMNREHFNGDEIYYGGALNVALGKLEKQAERMKRKMDAGCSFFMTQPVFSEEDIEKLIAIKKMTNAKIIAGIMPFVSYKNAKFMQNEFIGINVPDSIINAFSPEMSRDEAEETGASVAGELIKKISDSADGFYFMLPFNRVSLMEKLCPYI